MRKSSLIGFVLAPLSAVILAGGFLLTLPTFSRSVEAAEKDESCLLMKGEKTSACEDLVELQVHDVIPIEEAGTHAVVMVSSDGNTLLPIFVDEGAAIAIAFRLAERQSPHPLPQDLLDQVVDKMGGAVTQVRIDDVEDDIYTGRVVIKDRESEHAIDARPSDSIAMALSGHARIFASKKVMATAGITKEDLEGFGHGPGVGGSGPPQELFGPPAPGERISDDAAGTIKL